MSQNRREVSCSLRFSALTWGESLTIHISATVDISVFIEQRNISLQNDISLKTIILGVLSWEKLKHRETHGRIVSLDQLRLGVEEQLLIFSVSCLSPGQVKKLQKFINFCLRVGHSSNLKHSKSTWRQSSCDSCEMYKISTPRYGNNHREPTRSVCVADCYVMLNTLDLPFV